MTNSDLMQTSRSILVIGAGELGIPVLRSVASRAPQEGANVIVMLRKSAQRSDVPEKQRDIAEIRALGIDIVTGDLVEDSVDDLASLFSGYDTVIGCSGITTGIETPMKVARAALKAGVPRYFPWQFGADFEVIGRGSPQDIFDSQLDVRELLRAQDKTEWVIILTGIFMTYVFEPDAGLVDLAADTVHALGGLDTAVTLTTPEDIGRLTAEILFAKPRIRDEIVYIAGDTVTFGEVADTLEDVLKRPFQRQEWSAPFLLDELAKDPGNMWNKYRAVFALRRGLAWDKTETFNHRHGIPMTDLRSWIVENLTAR